MNEAGRAEKELRMGDLSPEEDGQRRAEAIRK